MFMAAFVLSVYVYLRRKEGCLAQASFVGVLRAKPDKKAINRKEEYEGKEEYEERRSAGHHCFVLDKQIGHQDTWTGVLPKNVYLERSRLREAAV